MSNVSQKEDLSFDLGRLVRILFMQSKLILCFLVLGFIFSITYYSLSPSVYNINSLIQIDTPSMGSQQGISSLMESPTSSSSSVDQNIVLYDTRTNMLSLITSLGLNVRIQDDAKRGLIEIQKFLIKDEDKYLSPLKFTIKANEENYNVLRGEEVIFEGLYYGQEFISEDFEFLIKKLKTGLDEKIEVHYYHPSSLAESYQVAIKVSNRSNNTALLYDRGGLIKVDYATQDIEEGIKIINKSNELFIQNSLSVKSERASKALGFINERLEALEKILEINKEELNKFQERNSTVNVDLEIEGILNKLSEIQKQMTDLELQEAKVRGSYTDTNPLYVNLQTQKEVLQEQKNFIEQEIKKLPTAQQAYIDLFRDVEISQDLYSDLLNRKLSYSIMEASTIGNIRVIDSAYKDRKLSPRLSRVLLIFLFFGIIGFTTAILRGLYFTPITNPAEIPDSGLNIPILGVFPDLERKDQFQQSLESLLVNLRLIGKDVKKSKILLVTSPSAENGKSLLSRTIATKMSELGSKSILIDCDLRRGDQHKELGKKTIEKDVIQNFSIQDIDQFKINENFYFVPRVKKIKDTFNWVDSPIFREFINALQESFDWIVIDTAPLLSVSDTSLLAGLSDIKLLIGRNNITRIPEISQSIESMNQIGDTFDGLIYNDFSIPRGYYGYYQYYANYSYQYYADKYLYTSYDYKNAED